MSSPIAPSMASAAVPAAVPLETGGHEAVYGALVDAAGADADADVDGELADALDAVDVEDGVRAGVAAVFTGETSAEQVGKRLGWALTAAAALHRSVGDGLLDGSGFGLVVPVIAGSPGAGASVVSAALTDVLSLLQQRVMLVDGADPARSGLASAATNDGPWVRQAGPVVVRWSWRQQALLARLEATLPVTPALVPPPAAMMPELMRSSPALAATVVDLGHDGWRILQDPVRGVGAWLRVRPAAGAVVVVRPSRPSLRHAEQVLARLQYAVRARVALPPLALVVVGARRWPADVVGAAGPRLQPLLEQAVFVPHDAGTAAAGVTDALIAQPVVEALLPLAIRLGLSAGQQATRRSLRQMRRATMKGAQ